MSGYILRVILAAVNPDAKIFIRFRPNTPQLAAGSFINNLEG
jgi:hypothetical protein